MTVRSRYDTIKARIDASRQARSIATRNSAAGRITALHWFILQVIAGLWWFWSRIGVKIWRIVRWPISVVWRGYRRLWDRFVYIQKPGYWVRFSYPRAGIMVTATIAAFFCLMPIIYFILTLMLYFATVKHNETVYLVNSQEIYPEENIHSVQGCANLPCDDQDSIYFRISPTWFNEAWSVVHNHALFYPDFVAAAIPVGISRCVITVYGFRAKMVLRNFDIYPDILKVRCYPIVGDQKEEQK